MCAISWKGQLLYHLIQMQNVRKGYKENITIEENKIVPVYVKNRIIYILAWLTEDTVTHTSENNITELKKALYKT